MTVQEAISALKQINLKRVHPFYNWEEMREVRDTAINALEKQIPKKPIKKNPICYEKTVDGQETYAYDCYCPTCDTNVNDEKHHCPCGQALDWSDAK